MGGGGSKKSSVIGHKYYLGFHLVYCLSGINTIRAIATDKKTVWTGSVSSNRTISVNKPNLFGGDPPEGQGGLSGSVDVCFGEPNQGVNGYLQSLNGGKIVPAYRDLFALVFKKFYVGNSPSIKPLRVLLEGDPTVPWRDDIKYINRSDVGYNEMNPVHIIRHLITSQRDGMAFSTNLINNDSFEAAAQTLFNEKFAISVKWIRQKSYGEIFKDIKKHINGEIFQNPYTGLWEIILLRNDYDIDSLPLLDTSNCTLNEFKRAGSSGACNDMTVKYHDIAKNRDSSVNQQDLALIDINDGQVVSITNDYPFISSKSLAREICSRDLRQSSTALANIKIECHQSAADGLLLGEPFKFTYEEEGCLETIFRAVKIDTGSPDKPRIIIDAVEDLYAFGYNTQESNVGNSWVPIVSDPEVLTIRETLEMPYPLAYQRWNEQQQLDGSAALMTVAARATQTDISYNLIVDLDNTGYKKIAKGGFTPWLLVTEALSRTDTAITYTASSDLDQISIPSMGIINGELVNITASDTTTNTMTIVRGCGKSIPRDHLALGRLWVISYSIGGYQDLAVNDFLKVKLQAINSNGSLEPAEIPADSITLTDQMEAPFPPANIKLNGENWPLSLTGEITITWKNRSRIVQQDVLTGYYENIDITEGEGDVRIRVYDQGGVLLENLTVPASSKTATFTPRSGTTSIRVEINSNVEGFESIEEYDRTINWIEPEPPEGISDSYLKIF